MGSDEVPQDTEPRCPPEDELAQLLEGTLADGARARVESHLAHCDVCRATVAALVRASDTQWSSRERAASAAALPSFGRYQIRRTVGAGAMGVVYAAWDPDLGREV